MMKKEIAVLCTALVFGSTIAAWANNCPVATAEVSTPGGACSLDRDWWGNQYAICTNEKYEAGSCAGAGSNNGCNTRQYKKAQSKYKPVNQSNCVGGCVEVLPRTDVDAVSAAQASTACHQP